MARSKFGLIFSDVHAGSEFALTPPPFRRSGIPKIDAHMPLADQRRVEFMHYCARTQKQHWLEFLAMIDPLPKLDYLIQMGDCIEGYCRIHDPVEMLTVDTGTQAAIYQHTIREIDRTKGCPKKVCIVGTPTHTVASSRDIEMDLYNAQENVVDIAYKASHINIGDVYWDLRHHTSSSGTFQGKHGQIVKEINRNMVDHNDGSEHDCSIFVRGHVHYHIDARLPAQGERGKIAFTMPCQKLRGEQYGRKFNREYHLGAVLFEIRPEWKLPRFEYLAMRKTDRTIRKPIHI